MKRLLAISCAIIALWLRPAAAGDWYVDPALGSDVSGDGSLANPWRTIGYSLEQVVGTAEDPADLHLAPGRYGVESGEMEELRLDDYENLEGAGPGRTYLEPYVVPAAHSRLRNMRVGVSVIDGAPFMYGCLLDGSGSYYVHNDSTPVFVNCTIVRSTNSLFMTSNQAVTAANCLFFMNAGGESLHGPIEWHATRTDSTGGPGTYRFEPAFVDFRAGDYRLRYDSPCRGAGDPAPDPAWGVDPGADLGAFPYAQIPYLAIRRLDFLDSPPGGDGDGLVEPGETIRIEPTIANHGEPCAFARLALRSSDDRVSVIEPGAVLGALDQGAEKTLPADERLAVRIDPGARRGEMFELVLRLIGEPGEDREQKVILAAGGPDFHVDPALGNDETGDGSPAAPWRTVSHAAAAVAGDPWHTLSIHLAAGTASTASGEVFPIDLGPFEELIGSPGLGSWMEHVDQEDPYSKILRVHALSGVQEIGFRGDVGAAVQSAWYSDIYGTWADGCQSDEDFHGDLINMGGSQSWSSSNTARGGSFLGPGIQYDNIGSNYGAAEYATGNLFSGGGGRSSGKPGRPALFANNEFDLTQSGHWYQEGVFILASSSFSGADDSDHLYLEGKPIVCHSVLSSVGIDFDPGVPYAYGVAHGNLTRGQGTSNRSGLSSYEIEAYSSNNVFLDWGHGINGIESTTYSANDTFSANGSGLSAVGCSIEARNDVLWDNDEDFDIYIGDLSIDYSDFENPYSGGTGNLHEDPLFVDPENLDFGLQAGSPCIDAGDPDFAYDDPDGTRNDMGMTGGPALDGCPPWIERVSPAPDAVDVPLSAILSLDLIDDLLQVKRETIELRVNDHLVKPEVLGIASGVSLVHVPEEPYAAGREVVVRLLAEDWSQPPNRLDVEATRFRVKEPGDAVTAALGMPGHEFLPGSPCRLDLVLDNHGAGTLSGGLVVIALDLGWGEYWFWPSWCLYPDCIDAGLMDIAPGSSVIRVIPEFTWPEGAGSVSGARFLAAVLDPTASALLSNLSVWEFSFSEP